MEPPKVTFEDYRILRRQQNSPPEEDYFRWKWSVRHFSTAMQSGNLIEPKDVTVLDSILENRAMRDVLVERALLIRSKSGLLMYHLLGVNEPKLKSFRDSEPELLEYNSRLSMARAQRLSRALLEVYGDDPELFMAMWGWAKSTGSLGCVDVDNPSNNETSYTPSMRSFCERVRKDYGDLRKSYPHADFSTGLEHFLVRMYQESIQTLVNERLDILHLRNSEAREDIQFLSTQNSMWPERKNLPDIIFSVAGTGKTQHLLDILSSHWGYYLVSGRVPQEHDSTQTLLTARQGLASSDTKYLCETLDRLHRYHASEIPDLPDEYSLSSIYGRSTWQLLLRNRENTFRLFLSKGGRPECQAWLLFQTVCTAKFDPFLDTFKILLLIENRMDCIPSETQVELSSHPVKNMLFCLDEAQCELSSEDDGGKNDAFDELLRHSYDGGKPTDEGSSFVAAGTSLQLDRFKKVFGDNIIDLTNRIPNMMYRTKPIPESSIVFGMEPYDAKVSSNSTYITSDAEFKSLLRYHVRRLVSKIDYVDHIEPQAQYDYKLYEVFAIENSQMKKEIFVERVTQLLDQVSTAADSVESVVQILVKAMGLDDSNREIEESLLSFSSLFRGRVRWNTLFIEHLFINCLLWPGFDLQITDDIGPVMPTECIKTAALIAREAIVAQIKDRIGELKRKGRYFLLKDLFLTAVRADLMNKPSILPDTESVQMVTEGFALLKASGDSSGSAPVTLASSATMSTSSPSTSSPQIATPPRIRKQELAEPLVIKTVVEYLLENDGTSMQGDNQSNRLERVMEQLLFDHQNSGVGDIAEPYLAWGFMSLFKRDPSSLLFPERKQNLLDLFKDANLIHRSNQPNAGPERLGNIGEYSLCESSAAKDTKIQENMKFDKWIQRIRNGEYFPTVLHPPPEAGPDIAFMLQHKSKPKCKILCALQLKTGLASPGLFKLLRTLDPNLWHSGKTLNRHQALSKAINDMGPDFRILTGLITPAPGNKVYVKGPDHLTEYLKNLQGPVQLYTSLANEKDEPKRQKIIQPLLADWGNEKTTRFAPQAATRSKTKEEYWTDVINAKLDKPNDHLQQTLRAESIVRIAAEECYNKGSLSPVPPIFLPRNDVQGRDFYFAVLTAEKVAGIFGESLGTLAQVLKE